MNDIEDFEYWESQFDDEEFILDDYGYHDFNEYENDNHPYEPEWDELDEEDYEDSGGALVPNKPNSNPTLDAEAELEEELVLV